MTPQKMKEVSDYYSAELRVQEIRPTEAARLLGIHTTYGSMIRYEKLFHQASLAAWDRVLLWKESGSRLRDWKKPYDLPIMKRDKKTEIVKPEIIEPRVEVKPEALEKKKKELTEQETKRATKGELIDMLIEEKVLLKAKIDAIDLLLAHYIS